MSVILAGTAFQMQMDQRKKIKLLHLCMILGYVVSVFFW